MLMQDRQAAPEIGPTRVDAARTSEHTVKRVKKND